MRTTIENFKAGRVLAGRFAIYKQRINRALEQRQQKLLTSRGSHQLENLGKYHIVDTSWNLLVDSEVDLLVSENNLKVVTDWEYLVAD